MDLSPNLPAAAQPWALAVDDIGSLYVAGTSAGFAFAQKFDRTAAPLYSVFLERANVQTSRAISVAVNETGEALVSGSIRYFASPESSTVTSTGFVAKVDAQGGVLFSIRGVGVGPATWDRTGNIYVAGGDATLPVTPGAFQTTHALIGCSGTGSVVMTCSYQQVFKLSADGQRVLYSTFLTGDYGAQPSAIAVNGQGELTIAGTTYSPNYPTTPGTFQPDYRAGHPPPSSTGPHPGVYPPAAAGFVTRLNATRTGLVWSTFFSGAQTDSISDMAILSDGRIAINGAAGSPDLPGLTGYPSGCQPWTGREQGFISTLSPGAETLLSTLVTWSPGRLLVLDSASARFGIVSRNGYRQYASTADQRDVCVAEPADWSFVEETAPGHLLTIFGNGLQNAPVDFNGVPAHIIYTSPGQINIQTPANLPPGQTATLRIGAAHSTIELPFRILSRTPRMYMGAVPFDPANRGVPCDGLSLPGSYQPEAFNADGTRNGCGNPALTATTVDLTLNGLGVDPPNVTLEDINTARIERLEYDPVYLKWQLRIRVWPASRDKFIAVTPIVNGVKLPYSPVVIWTTSNPG